MKSGRGLKFVIVILMAATALQVSGAVAGEADSTPLDIIEQVAKELTAAAPAASASDEAAYAAASRKLFDSSIIQRVSDEQILWGYHAEGKPLDPPEHSVTEFDPRVWRGEYLAEFMFTGAHEIKRQGAYTILYMDCAFRNAMDPGDYPYPFWHSQKKWNSYQLTKKLLFLFEKGKLVAAYRSSDEDPARPTVAREFDGHWQWTAKDGGVEPHISLYHNVFSNDNPGVAPLETAYRNLESAARESNCMSCHSPDNASQMKKLLLLNFPNQALISRHSIVKQLDANLMPPKDAEKGRPAGIGDEAQRAKLAALATIFAKAADDALEFEKHRVLKSAGISADEHSNLESKSTK